MSRILAAIQPSAESLHLPGSVRAHPAAEDSGVLLRVHPVHEGLPKDRDAPLQRFVSHPQSNDFFKKKSGPN